MVFFVELGCHELRGAQHRASVRAMHRGRKAQVSNADGARAGVYKNVFALDVSVDDRWRLLVQVLEPCEHLDTPAFNDPEA